VIEPASEAELLERARTLEGRTIAEIARSLGMRRPPRDPVRAKGGAGRVVELALGGAGDSEDGPDLPGLGVEIKTVPLDRAGHVRESTFVCRLDLDRFRLERERWETSRARRKLARVLFVPVEWLRGGDVGARRVGTARLFSPGPVEEALLRGDFEEIVGRMTTRGVLEVDAFVGRALQVRPKAPSSSVLVETISPEGEAVPSVPRGFYLRARFVEGILWGAPAP
jgi:DNA mismatch repair protein MutH